MGPNGAITRAEISNAGFTTDPPNCAFGDDYLLANFSTAAFRSRGFPVDGSGNVQIGNAWLTNSGGTLNINTMNSVQTGATLVAGGTGYYGTGAYATDPYGGVWQLTVTGNTVTGVTMYRAGRVAGTTPPANPIALTSSRDNPGTGATINVTWNTAGGDVTIQPNGGGLTRFGANAQNQFIIAPGTLAGNQIFFQQSGTGGYRFINGSVQMDSLLTNGATSYGTIMTVGAASQVRVGVGGNGLTLAGGSATTDPATITQDGTGGISISPAVSCSAQLTINGAGISFGSNLGASNADISKHVNLFGGQYGMGVTGGRLNYNAAGQHTFMVSSVDIATISTTGALTLASWAQIGGASGPTWTTGSGVPSSTQPVGSLYSRVSTWAAGATLYVSKGAGAWTAVASV